MIDYLALSVFRCYIQLSIFTITTILYIYFLVKLFLLFFCLLSQNNSLNLSKKCNRTILLVRNHFFDKKKIRPLLAQINTVILFVYQLSSINLLLINYILTILHIDEFLIT